MARREGKRPLEGQPPAQQLSFDLDDPTRSLPAWRWYVDRRVANVMARLASAHPSKWTDDQKSSLRPFRDDLTVAEGVLDVPYFERALRAYFDAALAIFHLPKSLPYPPP